MRLTLWILQWLSLPGFSALRNERPVEIDYATRRIDANKECSRTATRRLMVVCHDFNASCNFYKR